MAIIYSGPLTTLPKKFTDILPSDHSLYVYEDTDQQYIIYINKVELPISRTSEAVGYISFSIDFKYSETNVVFLNSTNGGKGIAKYLMIIVAYMSSNHGIDKMTLDDDSDLGPGRDKQTIEEKNDIYKSSGVVSKGIRKTRVYKKKAPAKKKVSIYKSLGCSYIEEPYPEMICSSKSMANEWSGFLVKYGTKGFFVI